MTPYLSIIVPVYNTEKYLKKCIESILEQKYTDYELILIDDGSTDSSPAICDDYARKDGRIKVIHKNHGEVMSARKTGLSHACGRYISFIDSDDWVEPHFYDIFFGDTQIEQADIILMTGYQREEDKTQKIHTHLKKGVYCQREIRKILVRGEIIPCLWLKIFKKELIKANIELVDNRVIRAEDRLCSYVCLLDAETVLVQDNYQYHYVRHDSACMRRYREKYRESLYYYARSIKKIRQEKKISFLDLLWNHSILKEMIYIIYHEFENQKMLMNKRELDALRNKFERLKLSQLLIKHESKTAIKARNVTERIILVLYFSRLFWLLNIYIQKIGKKILPEDD